MKKEIKISFKRADILILFAGLLLTSCSHKESLREQIQQIIENANGTVGVAIKNLDTNDTLSFNNTLRYPMQSVYKFPLAIAVLYQVDGGKLLLNQQIHIEKKDLLPNTWSPLREKYPEGNIDIPLSEIIGSTVSQSDNNGCDILFRLLGGTDNVEDCIYGLGINDISIKGTEEQMHSEWSVQFTNWCKPAAMVQLLELFYKKRILSESSNSFLWQLMVETTTGPNRIRGSLPSATIVAHKTGSSGRNESGLSAAVNDVGIVTLPNGQHLAIAVFVSNTSADDEISEKVIADITKAAFDFYCDKW